MLYQAESAWWLWCEPQRTDSFWNYPTAGKFSHSGIQWSPCCLIALQWFETWKDQDELWNTTTKIDRQNDTYIDK